LVGREYTRASHQILRVYGNPALWSGSMPVVTCTRRQFLVRDPDSAPIRRQFHRMRDSPPPGARLGRHGPALCLQWCIAPYRASGPTRYHVGSSCVGGSDNESSVAGAYVAIKFQPSSEEPRRQVHCLLDIHALFGNTAASVPVVQKVWRAGHRMDGQLRLKVHKSIRSGC